MDGWKSIAAYLNRTTRTVQRWEKQEGLPVHRIGHAVSSSVYAHPEELDAWWNERKARLEQPWPTGAEPVTGETREEAVTAELATPPSPAQLRLIAAAILALLVAAAFGAYIRPRPHRRFANAEVVTPVRRGNVELAVISPDATKVVYAWDVNNQHTLTLRDLASGEERVLLQGVYSRYYGLTFTRDGDFIYFVAQRSGAPSVLYRIPTLGGPETPILEHIDSPVTLSPDEKRIAYVRETAGETQLILAGVNGTDRKPLVSRRRPEYLDYPAWSPDGRTIVLSFVSPKGASLIAVDPEDSVERPIGNEVWDFLRFPVWLDSRTLAASVRVTRRSGERIMAISYPDGQAERLNLRGDRFMTLSAAADGRSLAGVLYQGTSSIWTADTSSTPREVLAPVAGSRGVGWSGSGKLLIGGQEVSSVAFDGTELTTLLRATPVSFFAVCGSRLVYGRSDPPNVGLWLAVLPGGPSKLLGPNWHEGRPVCSPDGEFAVYSDHWGPVYQVSLTDGKVQRLIEDAVVSPSVSWDNRWIAAYRNRTSTWGDPQEIAIYPRAGGRAVKTLPLRPAEFEWTPLRWTRDSKAVGYVEKQGRVANLWLQPANGGARRQVTNFQSGIVGDFDWSPDGNLALELGTTARDVFLVRDAGQ